MVGGFIVFIKNHLIERIIISFLAIAAIFILTLIFMDRFISYYYLDNNWVLIFFIIFLEMISVIIAYGINHLINIKSIELQLKTT